MIVFYRRIVCSTSVVIQTSICLSLRVHVPRKYFLWAQCIYVETTLGPMYILIGHMDPETLNPKPLWYPYRSLKEPLKDPLKEPLGFMFLT